MKKFLLFTLVLTLAVQSSLFLYADETPVGETVILEETLTEETPKEELPPEESVKEETPAEKQQTEELPKEQPKTEEQPEETPTEETPAEEKEQTPETNEEATSEENKTEAETTEKKIRLHIENFRYDAKDYDKKATDNPVYRFLDKVEFEIKLPEEYEDTFLKEIADTGETVECTIKSTWNPRGTMIILAEFKGDKGEITLWRSAMPSEFAVDKQKLKRDMVFYSAYYLEDGNLYANDAIAGNFDTRDKITFSGQVHEGEFYLLEMNVNGFKTVECENIEYEYMCKDTLTYVGKDNTDIITLLKRFEGRKIDTTQKKQDPEAWETPLKYTRNDGVEVDHYVTYAGKAMIEADPDNAPEWLKPLGDEAEMTIIGLRRTLDGEDDKRETTPMLRMKGNGKTVWFTLSSIGVKNRLTIEEDVPSVLVVKLNSLISFENFVRIRNTVTYDTVVLNLHYNNNERAELEFIEFEADGLSVTIEREEIDSIFGEDKLYADWI